MVSADSSVAIHCVPLEMREVPICAGKAEFKDQIGPNLSRNV